MSRDNETFQREAIAYLVDAGVTLTRNDWTLYKSDSTGYTLLDLSSNGPDFVSEEYDVLMDAVAKFIMRTRL